MKTNSTNKQGKRIQEELMLSFSEKNPMYESFCENYLDQCYGSKVETTQFLQLVFGYSATGCMINSPMNVWYKSTTNLRYELGLLRTPILANRVKSLRKLSNYKSGKLARLYGSMDSDELCSLCRKMIVLGEMDCNDPKLIEKCANLQAWLKEDHHLVDLLDMFNREVSYEDTFIGLHALWCIYILSIMEGKLLLHHSYSQCAGRCIEAIRDYIEYYYQDDMDVLHYLVEAVTGLHFHTVEEWQGKRFSKTRKNENKEDNPNA